LLLVSELAKPSHFKFVPQERGINLVAWWGERLMAFIWAATTLSILLWTSVASVLSISLFTEWFVTVTALIYVGILGVMMIHPSRELHIAAMPVGILLYFSRTGAFFTLWLDNSDFVRPNNFVERFALASSIVVFHTWGIWTDRRGHVDITGKGDNDQAFTST
jgi:hypothetical protein